MTLSTFCEKNPPEYQKHAYDCGPAVVAWVYRAWGKEAPSNLADFADEEGLIGGLEGMQSLLLPFSPTLDRTLSLFPAVTLIREDEAPEHWVVVLGRSNYSVLFMDPDPTEAGFRVEDLQLFHRWLSRPQHPFTALYVGPVPGFPSV